MKNVLVALVAVLTMSFATATFAADATPTAAPVQAQTTSAKKAVKVKKAVKKHKKVKKATKAKKAVFANATGAKKAAAKK